MSKYGSKVKKNASSLSARGCLLCGSKCSSGCGTACRDGCRVGCSYGYRGATTSIEQGK